MYLNRQIYFHSLNFVRNKITISGKNFGFTPVRITNGSPVILSSSFLYLIFFFSIYTGCLQMNGAVSKVNKNFISHLTRAKRTPSAAATFHVSHALPAVRSLVLTAGLRSQFPRWRRSRKRLSVCSVLRCPDL